MGVAKNIAFNGLAQTGNRVVRILDQLLLVPFFLTAWGAEYYGEWLTISMIPNVLALSDLGLGTAVSNSFVIAYSKGDKQGSSNIYKTGVIIISLCVLLGVGLSGFAIWGANAVGLLEKSIIEPQHIMASLVCLMSSRLFSFYSQLFEGFFRARHKAATAFNIYTFGGLIRIAVGLFTLSIGCDIVGFSIGQLLASLFINVTYAILAVRLIKDLPLGHFDKLIAVATVKIGFGFMLTPIYQSLYMQGSTFVVRIILGPTSVAVFNTVRTVCKSLHSIFATVNGSIYPELQIAFGKGDNNLVKKIYIYSIQLVSFVSLIGMIFLVIFGPSIYRLWTHNELQVPFDVWLIFISSIPLNAIWWTSGTVFRAINQPTRFSIYGFISALISVVLTVGLTHLMGLEGSALGFVAMDGIMFFLTLPLANQIVGANLSDMMNIYNLQNGIKGILSKRKYNNRK